MMKKLFTFLFFLAGLSFVTAQDIYYSEDFNAGLPADWVVEGEWVIGSSANVSSDYFEVPAADGNVACFNDDDLGQGATGGGTITSGAIDLTAVSGTAFLEMNSYFPNLDYQGNDETARIFISTNGGTDWDMILDITGGESAAFGAAFVDISAYVGNEVMLRFEYNDGNTWNYGWAFDNVQVSSEVTLADARSYRLHAGTSVIMNQALEGIEYYNDGLIFNYGFEEITSFDIVLSSGTTTITQTFDNVSIPYNGVARYYMDQAITVSGNSTWSVEITNVNGSSDLDADPSDNSMEFTLNATSVHPDKAVVVEEATGTWCPWCTRGTAYMEEMSKRFGEHFAGIAVHNGDPMVLSAYDNAITNFPGFSGFPSVIFQRESIIDPGDMVNPSLNEMNEAPPAKIGVFGGLDGNTLSTFVKVTFLEDVMGADYNVSIVLTESGMTGTAGNWGQANAYSGGGNGEMGGFELLPGTVPASLMVYNHVGRALIGGYDGVSGQVMGDFTAGESVYYTFDDYTVPNDMNTDKVHVIAIITNSSNGQVVNAYSTPLTALVPTSNKEIYDNTLAQVFPNPVRNTARVLMSLDGAKDISISVVNAMGQVVSTRDFGTLSGDFHLDYDMSDLATGVYFLHIKANDRVITKKINKVD